MLLFLQHPCTSSKAASDRVGGCSISVKMGCRDCAVVGSSKRYTVTTEPGLQLEYLDTRAT